MNKEELKYSRFEQAMETQYSRRSENMASGAVVGATLGFIGGRITGGQLIKDSKIKEASLQRELDTTYTQKQREIKRLIRRVAAKISTAASIGAVVSTIGLVGGNVASNPTASLGLYSLALGSLIATSIYSGRDEVTLSELVADFKASLTSKQLSIITNMEQLASDRTKTMVKSTAVGAFTGLSLGLALGLGTSSKK